jgi:hypothetical protein
MATTGEPEGFQVPGFVLDDLDANPGLVRKWLEDAAFREQVLHAENPGLVAAEHGFSISADTGAWIGERVRAHGAGLLRGATRGPIVAA